jgi:hypothetical protein
LVRWKRIVGNAWVRRQGSELEKRKRREGKAWVTLSQKLEGKMWENGAGMGWGKSLQFCKMGAFPYRVKSLAGIS